MSEESQCRGERGDQPDPSQEDSVGDTNKEADVDILREENKEDLKYMIKTEVNQDVISTKQSSSDSAVIQPTTPQACVDPPSPHSDSSQKEPTSAALRDKLRKTRFSFNSCCSVIKRLKVEKEENDQTLSEKPASSKEENSSEVQESSKNKGSEPEVQEGSKNKGSEPEENAHSKNTKIITACKSESLDLVIESPEQGLNREKAELMKQVQDKEELLRRLKLVKMYRSKNNLSQLELLISKWRNCSQLLLYELQSVMSEDKKLSLTQLIDHYGLDDQLLHYNRREEEFTGV